MNKLALLIPIILLLPIISACSSPLECQSTSSLLYSNNEKLHQSPQYLYKPFPDNGLHQLPTAYVNTQPKSYNQTIVITISVILFIILIILLIVLISSYG